MWQHIGEEIKIEDLNKEFLIKNLINKEFLVLTPGKEDLVEGTISFHGENSLSVTYEDFPPLAFNKSNILSINLEHKIIEISEFD